MPPTRFGLLALLVVFGLPQVAVGSWNPACTGEFACSSIDSDQLDLVDSFVDSNFVKCRYGHTEVDGTCERSCERTRTAACRCQTKEEAEQGVTSGAKTSLFVCIGIVCFGLCCGLSCCLCMRKCTSAEKRSLQADFEHAAAEQQPHAAGAAEEGNAEQAAEEGTAGAVAEGSQEEGENSPGSSPGTSATSPPAEAPPPLERALRKARLLGFENPKKAKIMIWFFPLLALGIAAWGGYEILSKQDRYEGQFYDHLETFLGIVAIAALLVAVILLLCTSIDSNPLICLVRTLTVAFQIIPLIGLAGLVWSAIRMSKPEGIYYACEARHCIFDVC